MNENLSTSNRNIVASRIPLFLTKKGCENPTRDNTQTEVFSNSILIDSKIHDLLF